MTSGTLPSRLFFSENFHVLRFLSQFFNPMFPFTELNHPFPVINIRYDSYCAFSIKLPILFAFFIISSQFTHHAGYFFSSPPDAKKGRVPMCPFECAVLFLYFTLCGYAFCLAMFKVDKGLGSVRLLEKDSFGSKERIPVIFILYCKFNPCYNRNK